MAASQTQRPDQSSIWSAFRPEPLAAPWWVRGGHLQTVVGHQRRTPRQFLEDWPQAREVRIEVEHGDRLLAYYLAPDSGQPRRVVCLFHGLAGDTDAEYIRRAARVVRARGWGVLAVNHRGAGPGVGPPQRPYHSGVNEDLGQAVSWARGEADSVWAVGYSLSGNVLALQMGRGQGEGVPDAALCVNAPIDLALCARRIGELRNKIYDWNFVQQLRELIEERREAGIIGDDAHRVPPFATLRTLDELYTAPQGGFRDADDYYARSSALPHLKNVSNPTLLLTAADDPFIDAVSYRNPEVSAAVGIHVEPTGGHLGYVAKATDNHPDGSWLDHAVGEWLRTCPGR